MIRAYTRHIQTWPINTWLLMVLMVTGAAAADGDWLRWRGPQQNGTSDETGLPSTWTPGGAGQVWEVPLAGRGTPVIRGERVYAFGYRGEGQDLQEVLACFDAGTGKELWAYGFNDFLSDIIYGRYAIGSPAIDGETGNVYVTSAAGILSAFTADGKVLWQHSLMEELGRMTFPNGRNGAPAIHRNLVIIHCMTSNWGAHGPAQDRFYAYDKRSGALVWSSSPGVRPKDNSFSSPVFGILHNREVFYAGTGCGNVVCINANTGEPIWRFPLSQGGVNTSLLLSGPESLIAVHAKENIDSSDSGRMVSLLVSQTPAQAKDGGTSMLEKSAEQWRNNEAVAYSSSPVKVGNRVYITSETGELCALDVAGGRLLWREKLGIEQLHSSLVYGDGKLYVPIKDGVFAIVKPNDERPEILCKVQVEGECNGAPAISHGRVYLFTTKKLYCFGTVRVAPASAPVVALPMSNAAAVKLMAVPAEVLLRPGEKLPVQLHGVDSNGIPTTAMPTGAATWASFIPPTAKVKSLLGAIFPDPATIQAKPESIPSAGMFEATADGLKGYLRGRVLPALPLSQDFESFKVEVDHATEQGVKFAYPPLPWIGARSKWEVREVGGSKVLAKTLDNKIFQRAMTFVGTPDMTNYTIVADVMTDGNKRRMSEVGVINQRYVVILKGNAQELEVNSNLERVRASVPFVIKPSAWYRLKARVDVAADGSGVVRVKAWPRADAEPAAWTLEVPHSHAHTHGSPGLFAFTPTDMRVYVDHLTVTSNAQ
ncbi:MAG: PQQ-binding-like beta-propeller repeat protein [Planctomycetota bacterium]